MIKTESGRWKIAEDDLRTLIDTVYAIGRRQDVLCMWLAGQTLNGESAIKIDPTPDSWCGRITAELYDIKKVALALEKRLIWGAAFVVVRVSRSRLSDKSTYDSVDIIYDDDLVLYDSTF